MIDHNVTTIEKPLAAAMAHHTQYATSDGGTEDARRKMTPTGEEDTPAASTVAPRSRLW